MVGRDSNLTASTPHLVDVHQAAEMLGVCTGTINNLRKHGEIPSLKIGTRRLFDIADLQRYIETRKAVSK